MASAALAINRPATLFFTMGASRALLANGRDGGPGWHDLVADGGAADADRELGARGVGTFEELLEACVALDARFLVCEMGLRALGLDQAPLRADVPIEEGGLVTFLTDAKDGRQMLFV
jgi:peroxiredoxin family protein